jgi:hypothetical protein
MSILMTIIDSEESLSSVKVPNCDKLVVISEICEFSNHTYDLLMRIGLLLCCA